MSHIQLTLKACLSIFLTFSVWGAFNFLADHLVHSNTRAPNDEKSFIAKFFSKTESKNGASKTQTPIVVNSSKRDVVLPDVKAAKHGEVKESVLNYDPAILAANWGILKTNSHKAWEVSQGNKEIIVAVIDTGADISHKGIRDNLWTNQGETGKDKLGLNKENNNIDDDGNGYIDDVHGFSFVQNNGTNLSDNHSHGTHIAGIIGARGTKAGESRGVCPNVSLMILKYYDPKVPNTNNLKNTVDSIKYAVKMKDQLDKQAKEKGTPGISMIINYSGGGTEFSQEEHDAVKLAGEHGILFVAAAGNEHSNSDEKGKHYYPADYGLTNIISVTAVNKSETTVLPSSNYGVRSVDLAAPGENIYSTVPGGGYNLMTGTSQATAFVTGVAALVWGHNRELNASDVKKYIIKTGDEYPTLLSKTGSAKLLNSFKALVKIDQGIAATGVIAANTGNLTPRSFASSQDERDPTLNTSALMNYSGQTEATESMAQFGRDFIKILDANQKNNLN